MSAAILTTAVMLQYWRSRFEREADRTYTVNRGNALPAMRAASSAAFWRHRHEAALAAHYLDGASVRLAALWPELAANAEPIPPEALRP